ncbi:RluA family pseudouridine synthase [Paenibacillaceae bacterium]|nr:RluA family pseudouridine synthase [Paenibacillaceae bacterium]
MSPHQLRQWLLEKTDLPAKWVNRLFSEGGLQCHDGKAMMRAFPVYDLKRHELYGLAAASLHEAMPPLLYEDDHCLVIHKPVGMSVHPAHPQEGGSLDEAVLRYLLVSGQQVLARHIHRLDKDTSGPVLYAKNDLAQWRLDEAMRAKEIERIYVALVQGVPSPLIGTIDLPIGRDRHHASRQLISKSGKPAITHYQVVKAYSLGALVRIRLETGRTHQIRVHFSHLGHPLVGDCLYGAMIGKQALAPLSHQALHGESLLFKHPLTMEPLDIATPVPPWFDQAQQALTARSKL